MIFHIFNIIAPVFIVIGVGYFSIKRGLFAEQFIDGLMKYAIQFAVPCLLFLATARLELASAYNGSMIAAFYIGSSSSFALASYLAYKVFKRHPGESIAIGFGALFSNLVLIGIPVSERAWGADNLSPVYAIISLHAPFCYLIGITSMEVLRSDGRSWSGTTKVVAKAMFSNTLMIGIGLGFLFNLSGLELPGVLEASINMVSVSALPVALFGLGGVLARYRITDSIGEVSMISSFSLLLHPAIAYTLCTLFKVPLDLTRAAVLLAAMSPGVNAYVFASLYQRGQSIAAGVVVVGTSMSILTVSFWLWVLS